MLCVFAGKCPGECAWFELIREVLQLDISISCICWGIRVPFCFFWSLFSVYQKCWRTRRKGVRRCHNTDTCGALSGGLQDLVLFSSTANVKGFLEYQQSGQRNSMVITDLHKYRVNGSGQSLSVRTIKKTLARKAESVSQYTYTLTMKTDLLHSNFNAFYYTVNHKSSDKYVSTSSI